MTTEPEPADQHQPPSGSRSETAAVRVERGSTIHQLHVGQAEGRDILNFTEDITFDVSGIPNPYLGLSSYTYATRLYYAGRERAVDEAVAKLAGHADPLLVT